MQPATRAGTSYDIFYGIFSVKCSKKFINIENWRIFSFFFHSFSMYLNSKSNFKYKKPS